MIYHGIKITLACKHPPPPLNHQQPVVTMVLREEGHLGMKIHSEIAFRYQFYSRCNLERLWLVEKTSQELSLLIVRL